MQNNERTGRTKPQGDVIPEERKLLPFLIVLLPAVLSGRSINALRMCPGDVIAGSLAVFLGLIFGIVLHAGGVTLGLLTIGLPLEDAVKIAAIPALALAVLDIKFQQARDQEKALKIARETRPDLPRTLQGGFGFALRPLVSLTSGMVLGTFVLLALFQGDTNDLLGKWQEAEDERIAADYASDIDARRETLAVAVARAKTELDTALVNDPRSTAAADKKRLGEERAKIEADISKLRVSLREALEERDDQRHQMYCEENGVVDDTCPNASGQAGKKRKYLLAKGLADRADGRAVAIADEISALESNLVKVEQEIQALEISPDRPPAIAKASAALADAEKALREFDPAARTAELVAACLTSAPMEQIRPIA